MKKPLITWFVRRDPEDGYEETNDFYAGSYNQEDNLEIEFMIWNNRYGTERVSDLRDFGITVSFDHEEDSGLLKYCQFMLNGGYWLSPNVVGNEAKVQFPADTVLSGAINNGESGSTENYITLKMVLSVPAGKKLKMNDIKGMTFNISNL